MGVPSPTHCRQIIPLLEARDGQNTRVELSNGRTLDVFDIAAGRDLTDEYDHISTNVSPPVDGREFTSFFTDEVARVVDPVSGDVLWEADGTPTVR